MRATCVRSVGCNKGWHSVELFDLWAPGLGVSKGALYQAYKPLVKWVGVQGRGVLGQCDQNVANTTTQGEEMCGSVASDGKTGHPRVQCSLRSPPS